MPASIEPSMTASAPAAIALAMSPELVMPPSAMTGTSCRAAAETTVEDRGHLGNADARDDPRGADAPRPDAHLDGVGPGVDHRLGRRGGRDVAGDELDVAEPLQLPHHLEHALRVAVRRVDDEDVDVGRDERLRAFDRVAADADRGADAQPAALVLARVRVLDLLLDVLDGDQALEETSPRRRPAASRSCCGGGSPPPPPAWCRPARSRGRGWSSAPRPSARRRSRSGGRGW